MPDSTPTEKQTIEERRLALEERRFAKDSSFFSRHTGPIVIALIGGFFSWAQIQVAQIQKDRELQVTELQKNKELSLATLEQERRWKLDLSEFVFKHRDLIFSKDPVESVRIRNVLLVTFPTEVTKPLFESVENVVPPGQKATWKEGQSLATSLATYNSGVSNMKVGKYDQAIADFSQVIISDPSHVNAYYNRGVSYTKTGQNAKAIDDFKKVKELSNNSALQQKAEYNLRILGEE